MKKCFVLVFGGTMGLLGVGCSSAREVEVTGEVQAATGVAVEGEILVDFQDVVEEGEPPESVVKTTLADLGAFAQKGDFEGDTIRVFAVNDKNGDGACSMGEAWAEASAPIGEDDTVQPVTLTLRNGACPAAP